MDGKTPEIRPVVLEPWVALDHKIRAPASVKPVPRDEGASFRKIGREPEARQRRQYASPKGQKAKELTREIQCHLSDINVDLSLEVYDKNGDLVVKIIHPDTRELIREIPLEDLLKLRDKLEELRGVLFARKA